MTARSCGHRPYVRSLACEKTPGCTCGRVSSGAMTGIARTVGVPQAGVRHRGAGGAWFFRSVGAFEEPDGARAAANSITGYLEPFRGGIGEIEQPAIATFIVFVRHGQGCSVIRNGDIG